MLLKKSKVIDNDFLLGFPIICFVFLPVFLNNTQFYSFEQIPACSGCWNIFKNIQVIFLVKLPVWFSRISFCGPITILFSTMAVICSSVKVFPSILSEECMVRILFCFRNWGDGRSEWYAFSCPNFSEMKVISLKSVQ